MDINQTPLSRYKTNKTDNPISSADSKAMSDTEKSKDISGSAAQNSKPLELEEGRILKGQIIDHRYNEVKIQLEPGKQIVTARLSGDVLLSIGQDARFVVASEGSDQLILKYIPNDTAVPADTVIFKALSASGMPFSERNKSIVSELLNQRMPVDKQTLQFLIKMSVTNREASPLTLVLMMKNDIPMTTENIRQFEDYKNGTHQLLSDIRTIAQEAAGFFKSASASLTGISANGPNPGQNLNSVIALNLNLSEGQSKANILSNNNSLNTLLQLNGKLLNILNSTDMSQENPSVQAQLKNLLKPEELSLLNKVFEQAFRENPDVSSGLPSDLAQRLNDGGLSLKDTMSLLTRLNISPEKLQLKLQEILRQSLKNNLPDTAQTDASLTRIIANLFQTSGLNQDNSPRLSDILSPANRAILSGYLSSIPDADEISLRISQGTASLKETLDYIQKYLTEKDPASALEFLKTPEYSRLLEEAFLQRWTISPEKLSKKEPVQELFNGLREDLDKLSSLLKAEKTTEEIVRLQEPVKNMQENLQFMKDLNELYTYLQLPVRLKDRNAHTDLYVLTRNKALNDKREKLSALLHLEMANLGQVNIHIQMDSKELQADFYIEKKEAGRLIKDNLPVLTDALADKGYNLKAKVKDDYRKPDFCKDFIEQNSADNLIQRYTFDIRT